MIVVGINGGGMVMHDEDCKTLLSYCVLFKNMLK